MLWWRFSSYHFSLPLIELCIFIILNISTCDHSVEIIRGKKIIFHPLHKTQGFLLTCSPSLFFYFLFGKYFLSLPRLQLPGTGGSLWVNCFSLKVEDHKGIGSNLNLLPGAPENPADSSQVTSTWASGPCQPVLTLCNGFEIKIFLSICFIC